ncbi:TIGR00645 family protein [Ruania halotolerans]|uniref:TIGR00645 family protein n=1 Tax=Ruania halotolerans TaxID=2897773 RepID=UPI001E474500|nr:TIGR00645 family protein [Ruania halotolerans]UFU05173.1 TIGR00645 family protein [Ruania halotolerans]
MSELPEAENPAGRHPGASPLGYLIFLSRWLQVPLYLGLIVAQAVYVWQFMKELWHLIEYTVLGDETHVHADYADMTSEAQTMLFVLGLVDVVMISNLLIMVIIGGYETFVSRIRLNNHPDQPEWLSHVNANVLKTKLAMSIIGISSIHLLRTFINSEHVTPETMMWQTLIHIAFILSAIALAWIDKMSLSQSERAAKARAQAQPDAHSPA